MAYGIKQEFITPYTPEQNGLIERFIRTIKEQCIYQNRFETISNARVKIASWIKFYNMKRPHQALNMKAPNQIYNEIVA